MVGAQDPRGAYTDDTAIQDDSYAYDAVGNRLSLTDNLTNEQVLYTYDDFNKLLTAGNRSFTYDADGNCTSVALQGGGTTRTYHWGYNNELLQITYGGGGTNTFTYDGIGRRVTKVDSTGSYSFVYDGNRIISDGQAVYTRARGSRLISERRGNNSQWYHADGLTSTRTLTNSNQTTTDTFRYDVWGDIAERTGNTPTPHQFVGALGYEREADSGLYFIGTRYYDPSVGRFLSQDAAQWGVNWYVYAANNPVSGFDYQGQWWETALDIAGLILDVKDFIEKPSLGNAAWIIGDVASIILPTPTPSLIKHGGKLIDDVVKHGDEVVDGALKLVDDACFVAGTPVPTLAGLKPIEAVQAGDWVCSKDERTGAVSYQRVKRTFQRVSDTIVTVKAGNETIKTTPEHPFWVAGKGWVAAKELARGDRLITPDEKVAVVGEVRVEAVRGPPVVVYNLEVENTHTYFVGRSGVWVHNACDPLYLYRGVGTDELETVLNTGRFPVNIPGGRMDDTLWLTTNPRNASQYGTVVKAPVDPDGLAGMINGGEAFYDALGWMDQVRVPKPNIEKFNDIIIGPITKYDPWEHYR